MQRFPGKANARHFLLSVGKKSAAQSLLIKNYDELRSEAEALQQAAEGINTKIQFTRGSVKQI